MSEAEVAALVADAELLARPRHRAGHEPSRLRRRPAPPHERASSSPLSTGCARSCRRRRASLADSGGLMLGTDFHFDLVRPGYRALRRPGARGRAEPGAAGGARLGAHPAGAGRRRRRTRSATAHLPRRVAARASPPSPRLRRRHLPPCQRGDRRERRRRRHRRQARARSSAASRWISSPSTSPTCRRAGAARGDWVEVIGPRSAARRRRPTAPAPSATRC